MSLALSLSILPINISKESLLASASAFTWHTAFFVSLPKKPWIETFLPWPYKIPMRCLSGPRLTATVSRFGVSYFLFCCLKTVYLPSKVINLRGLERRPGGRGVFRHQETSRPRGFAVPKIRTPSSSFDFWQPIFFCHNLVLLPLTTWVNFCSEQSQGEGAKLKLWPENAWGG